ncbi:MAG: ATP-binding protein [Chloroflexota bacterium]
MAVDLRVPIGNEGDIVLARHTARLLARELGFGLVDQSRIATAVSELARNVVRYADGARGVMEARRVSRTNSIEGIEVVIADEGPGIQDVELALSHGYSSGHGLGLGLPGAKRLMDEMEVDSTVGRGTRVTIRKWRR